ncbi:MAG: hypothetical protein M1815_004145 [Lichina confinis]|nr:MAG: hypothetical protein M1815_004145 [Lichina confinis]
MSLGVRLPDSTARSTAGSSAAQAAPGNDRPFNVNLASNNPFRNRASTPGTTPPTDPSPSPANPFFARFHPDHPAVVGGNATAANNTRRSSSLSQNRPLSRNPFLEPAETMERSSVSGRNQQPPLIASFAPFEPAFASAEGAADQLGGLRLDDYARGDENYRPSAGDHRLAPALAGHRVTRSQEEDARPYHNRGAPPSNAPRRSSPVRNVFDPPLTVPGRPGVGPPRRNSESSVADARDVDERKHRERERERRRQHHHREREVRDRDGRPEGAVARASTRTKKPGHKLDVIDKLDVTSIYGTGFFHHDGPFDACNPHRNRKGSRRAPMQAFAKDSANNAIGGSGPVNNDIDRAQYLGDRGSEAFADFSQSRVKPVGGAGAGAGVGAGAGDVGVGGAGGDSDARYRPRPDRLQSFDPVVRVDPVHGDESMGLGTSTFLEGAPASKTAMQRRESESDHVGISRKKSLAKKIRGLNPNRQHGTISRRSGSVDLKQDALHAAPRDGNGPNTGPMTAPSATAPNGTESNPFFSEFDPEQNTKADRVPGPGRYVPGHERQPSSPRRGRERSITQDSSGIKQEPAEAKSGGFLSRVKSLRGGRRARPAERAV